MPSKSKAQHRTMQAAAHNPAFAQRLGIPQKVAKDYTAADEDEDMSSLPARKSTPHSDRMKRMYK